MRRRDVRHLRREPAKNALGPSPRECFTWVAASPEANNEYHDKCMPRTSLLIACLWIIIYFHYIRWFLADEVKSPPGWTEF